MLICIIFFLIMCILLLVVQMNVEQKVAMIRVEWG